MPKIVYLENGTTQSRVWYVWQDANGYQALDASGKTKREAISLLPDPKPNFIMQVARSRKEAIALVEGYFIQELLSPPV